MWLPYFSTDYSTYLTMTLRNDSSTDSDRNPTHADLHNNCLRLFYVCTRTACISLVHHMQLRAIMHKKLTTSVEEDASVSEHYNEVCKREARVRRPTLRHPMQSALLSILIFYDACFNFLMP